MENIIQNKGKIRRNDTRRSSEYYYENTNVVKMEFQIDENGREFPILPKKSVVDF